MIVAEGHCAECKVHFCCCRCGDITVQSKSPILLITGLEIKLIETEPISNEIQSAMFTQSKVANWQIKGKKPERVVLTGDELSQVAAAQQLADKLAA